MKTKRSGRTPDVRGKALTTAAIVAAAVLLAAFFHYGRPAHQDDGSAPAERGQAETERAGDERAEAVSNEPDGAEKTDPGMGTPSPDGSNHVLVEPGEVEMKDRVTVENTGITFHFDGDYTTGTFANGDPWVVGPVTITRIEPDAEVDYHNLGGELCTGGSAALNACRAHVEEHYPGYGWYCDGERRGTGDLIVSYIEHGWEVNPVVEGPQGFDSGTGSPDASLVPDLPYTAEGSQSIVKTVSSGERRPVVRSAAVLTVVDDVPPGNGAEVFRPPYVGNDKPYYYVGDLRTDLLPSYAPVPHTPDLDSVVERYRPLQMDHKGGGTGRALRPQDSMANYQPRNTDNQSNAAMRLMVGDDLEEKLPALVQFVQFGIDKIHMIYLGQTWPSGGGHQPGHRLAPAFAAVMLDIDEAKELLREAEFFHGNRMFHRRENSNGLALWGNETIDEGRYWTYVETGQGNRSHSDPYGHIDGGGPPGGAYQNITSQSHKGEVLATHLMPALKEAWNLAELDKVRCYVDRWVLHGTWARPDPYAPFDGDPGNRGVTYGPDPDRPGEAIAGGGRFPERHGENRDGGQYRSRFVAAMWDAYRHEAEGADDTPPFAAIISPLDGDAVSGMVELETTTFGIHGIQNVQYLLDGEDLGEPVTGEPYVRSWDTAGLGDGPYALTAVATDELGNTFASAPVTVQLDNSN